MLHRLVLLVSLDYATYHRELEKARSASLPDVSYDMAGVYSYANGLPA
jgi:hypothetical protein